MVIAAATIRAKDSLSSANQDNSNKPKQRVVVLKKKTIIVRRNHSSSSTTTTTQNWNELVAKLFRVLFLEGLFITSIFGILCILQGALHLHSTVIHPYLQAIEWTDSRAAKEQTYPAFDCAAMEQAVTLNVSQRDWMFFNASTSTEYATDFVMQHGGAVFPDLISDEDGAELRHYLLRQSYMNAQLPVISQNHRRSIALTALEHRSLTRALSSIARSTLLRTTLEKLLGPNPALFALSTIIAEEGADDQPFHVDKPPRGSAMQYTATFIPTYALLIPLQDTTVEMGTTAITPGTHRCDEMNRSFAEEKGFHAVGGGTTDDTQLWKAGHGLLYHGQVRHRGSAHTKGPPRVVLILTFGSKPDGHRSLPLGSYFALRWNMWGFTLRDLTHPELYMSLPWLRSLGLWKHADADWGWTALDDFCALFADHRYSKLGASLYNKLRHSPWGILASSIMIGSSEGEDQMRGDNRRQWAPYEKYFVVLVQRLRWLVLLLLGVVLVKYFDFVSHSSPKDTTFAAMRILVLCLVPASLVVGMVFRIQHYYKTLGVVPKSHPQIELPAYDSGNQMDGGVAPRSEPQFTDVLISSAAVQYKGYTAAYARLLDFHEGNRQWREMATQVLSLDAVEMPLVLAAEIIANATQGTMRFLKQVDSGWVQMNQDEIYRATLDLVEEMTPSKLHTSQEECAAEDGCNATF